MITDRDRSYYFGASDTDKIIGNWKTKTWEKWWMQKLGINNDHFDNEYTKAGSNWEHRILDSLHIPNLEKDKQIIVEDLRLKRRITAGFVAAGADFQAVGQPDVALVDRADLADDGLRLDPGGADDLRV